ncbi:MAG TPA: efflux RND transporter periplasmic adaptor subunit [Puia sp.]|uniref:efflux RND transporter periplasmic adaptor subunit n=1 Tax=Puia sp. TaxID=2045100 RepID=UPI002CDFE1B1|nr:efflux RND transporter periplasmic adaptor subunit [Puia sp.]HVU99049.1 efflux RND transporter periplasmic adaptor subunit [Puia sp.]
MKAIVKFFILPALVLTLLLESCSSPAPSDDRGVSQSPVPVTVGMASGNRIGGIAAAGRVEALRSATMATRVMGTITRVFVKVGDKVRQGQLLATISGQDLDARKAQADAQIAAATAAADNAQKDLARYTSLYSRGSATASELDNATLRYKGAAANLAAAREARKEADASMAYTRLTAPFDGVVTAKAADEGSLASPGAPLLTVEQAGVLQVTATVAEDEVAAIRRGQKVRITVNAADLATEGVVSEVGASSIATGGQYPVKISLPPAAQKNLYAGMYVNLVFPAPGKSPAGVSVLVPSSALVHNDQLTGLFVPSNANTALLRWIRTGRTYGDEVEVLSGLAANEPFVLQADGKLYNGAPIRKK